MKANQLFSQNIVFFLDYLEFLQVGFIFAECWPQRQLSSMFAYQAFVSIGLFHSFFDLHSVLLFVACQKLLEKEALKLC
jgi:hypothetical protein